MLAHQLPLPHVERPGLVDDLLGHGDLADVVETRGVLGPALLPPVETELDGNLGGQGHDALAVRPRVFVVLLDQVREQDRGAEVGVAQLQRLLEAPAALPREEREQAEQRQQGQEQDPLLRGGDGRDQRDRRQHPVDGPDPGGVAQLAPRRDAVLVPLAHGGDGEVHGELREQSREIDGPVPQTDVEVAGDLQHERRADRVPGVAERDEHPLRVPLPAQVLGQLADDVPGEYEQRGHRGVEQHQHRHQRELGRHGEARAHVEADV